MEASGKISFMPYSGKRPATPEDLKIVPNAEKLFYNVIMDGAILKENLRSSGKDENWLKNELKAQGFKNTNRIYLATLDSSGTLNVFENIDGNNKNDFFE